MKRKRIIYGMITMLLLAMLSGCSESDALIDGITGDDSNVIHVGGIDRDLQTVSLAGYTTRANGDNEPEAGDKVPVDAETVNWMLGPLFGGLDITYGLKGKESETQKVAILKLQKKNPDSDDISSSNIKYSDYTGIDGEKIAEYSFRYRESGGKEGDEAIWYDNGVHYFQGVYVPQQLRYLSESSQTPETVNAPETGTAKNLLLDQSKETDTDNYTLLARYLGMPADATIHATVGRVKLPFRHRLARVLAYVLIDPTMGNDVTIQGYNLVNDKDDAATSEIKFCNVEVLAGVEQKDDATGHATLTPRWHESRKVIPHFVEESGSKNSLGETINTNNFIMFYDSEEKEYIFPTDDDKWVEANTKWNAAYNDALAVQQADDPRRESKAAEVADKNTKLKRTKYGKVPVYDLIVRPTYKSADMVMYDEDLTGISKEALVTLKNNIDFEITLSNGLEYTKQFEFDLDANYQTIVYLRISRESIDYNSSGADTWKEETSNDGYYGVNNQNGNTLSYAGSSWQRAYRIGTKHDPITDGHFYDKDDEDKYAQYVDETTWLEMFAEAYKGGKHHGDYFILDNDITVDVSKFPANFVFTGHLDGQDKLITITGTNQTVVDKDAYDEYVPATTDDYSETLYVENAGSYSQYSLPELYKKENDEYVIANNISVEDMMNGTFYIKVPDEQYEEYTKPKLYKKVHHEAETHTSGSTLFAGLNGAYTAAKGVANVHEENGILVPYVDDDTKTGWRAEVINTKISGADMFPSDAIVDGKYDVTKVSGYIYNCWKGSEKIKSHTPTLPKYN